MQISVLRAHLMCLLFSYSSAIGATSAADSAVAQRRLAHPEPDVYRICDNQDYMLTDGVYPAWQTTAAECRSFMYTADGVKQYDFADMALVLDSDDAIGMCVLMAYMLDPKNLAWYS